MQANSTTPATLPPTPPAHMYRIPRYRIQLVRDSSQGSEQRQVQAPAEAVDILRAYVGDPDREMMVALLLDVKNRPIGLHTVSVGTLNTSNVRIADTFKAAILANAAAMIICHNHPSGDPSPSRDDITVTRQLWQAGKLLDIELLDHVILGEGTRWLSMKERGLGFE